MQRWLCVGYTTKRGRAGYLEVRLTENHGWLEGGGRRIGLRIEFPASLNTGSGSHCPRHFIEDSTPNASGFGFGITSKGIPIVWNARHPATGLAGIYIAWKFPLVRVSEASPVMSQLSICRQRIFNHEVDCWQSKAIRADDIQRGAYYVIIAT